MKDFNDVVESQRQQWEFEDKLPFKTYFERIQTELQRVGFQPTPEQLDAILHLDKITLIDSTAGSGKTTTIVTKSILDEIVWGIEPYHIVFLTFSKKSANDMKRKRDLFLKKHYQAKNHARMSTLHSLCFKFLETFYKEPGGLHAFSINRLISDGLESFADLEGFETAPSKETTGIDFDDYDDYDDYDTSDYSSSGGDAVKKSVIDIMKRFINEDKDLEYINNLNEMKNIMSCFAFQKERMLDDRQICEERIFKSLQCQPKDYFNLKNKVEGYKKTFEYFDFTDLQVKTLEILREHRDFFYSNNTFKMVFKPVKLYVDEFQDMTPLQKQVIKELVEIPVDDGRQTSLVCIGDGDQRIYTWRGSDSIVFDDFCKVFDPTKEKAKLKIFSKNHRCGENILNVASKLIDHNVLRNPKDMEAREGSKGKFEVVHYMSSKDMIESVVKGIIGDAREFGKESLEGTAVIYREHSQVMGIVTALLRAEIPFDLSGMKLPYKHWIFKNLMEMCESLLFDYREPYVDIIYKFVGINKKDIGAIKESMTKLSLERGDNVGWLDVLENNLKQGKKPMIGREPLVELKTMKKLLRESRDASIRKILQKLYSLYTLHNLDYVLKNLIFCERTEIESIEYFINSIPSRETYDEFRTNLADWDRYIANYRSQKYGVKLMSMHSTKGLEFKKVMIIGLDSEYQPKESYLQELDEKNQQEYIEEERRLLFVGITRAINECTVYANLTNPSRFLPEIDPSVADILKQRQEQKEREEQERLKNEQNEVKQPLQRRLPEVIERFTAKTKYDELFKEEFKCFLSLK